MINFMKFKWLYFLLSSLVLVPGIISLFLFGLKPSIDFTGGSLLEYKFSKQIDRSKMETILKEKQVEFSSLQAAGGNTYLIKAKTLDSQKSEEIKRSLENSLGEEPEELRFETIGPVLGKELLLKTATAVILATMFILAYVAWAFKDAKFGICAILAMFHDTLVMLGVFSLLGKFYSVEVDTLFVTAMLTVLSFSVHDTVVVYDRIRESQRRFLGIPFPDLVNKAVTETLPRSLNNSLTIIFMLLALILLGGETIKWFVFALLVGTVSGTYSSTFTAAPLLVILENLKAKKESFKGQSG